jgi:uncharacterized membrane protein YbhN (UPF0104 family)
VHSPAATSLETPSLRISRRRALVLVAAGGALVASLVFVLPSFADLPGTWERLTHGDARWLVLALGLEAVSFLGHIVLFRAVGDDGRGRVGMRASAEITLAGHAATRLFASGGAGGVALTAWALRRSGMERADVAARMTTFLVLLYAVYMAALVLGGVGLFVGVLPGTAPLALTLVPAAFGAVAIAVALALPRLSDVLERAQQRGAASAGSRPRRAGSAKASAMRCGWRAAWTRDSSARCCGGPATWRCCGRASRRSASRPRWPSS